jgi:hypothetical protein
MSKLVGVMCVIAVLGSLAGCAKDDGDDDAMNAGTGGATAGAGGSTMVAGSGGVIAGAGGAAAGAGGSVAGTGGAAAGAGGSVAGAGGMMAGTGGAGMAGMGGGAMDCSTADMTATPAALHAAAAEVLTAQSPCGFSGCHVGTTPAAMLTLMGSTDLHMTLVDKVPCEAPNMKLVDGSGGDAALMNSWVWIKLTAMASDTTGIMEQASFGTPGVCGQMSGQKYGVRMPATTPAAETLSQERLTKIRNWICAGAPGPQ